MTRRFKLLVGMVSILVLVAIAIPTGLLVSEHLSKGDQAIVQAVLTGFTQQYGADAQILQMAKPTNEYIIVWQDKENRYASLYVDGIFVKIAQVPIAAGE